MSATVKSRTFVWILSLELSHVKIIFEKHLKALLKYHRLLIYNLRTTTFDPLPPPFLESDAATLDLRLALN